MPRQREAMNTVAAKEEEETFRQFKELVANTKLNAMMSSTRCVNLSEARTEWITSSRDGFVEAFQWGHA